MSTLLERTVIEFTVYGTPRPQGSTRAFIPKGWKRAIITTDNERLKPWRQEVSGAALSAQPEPCEIPFAADVPLRLTMAFYFEKPKSAPKRRSEPTVKPDLDKICRAMFDALAGILFHDDAQVVELHTRKRYGAPERVEIRLQEATQ